MCSFNLLRVNVFLKRVQIELSYNPAIPLQDIYPKELKMDIFMFEAALFTADKS